MSVMVVPQGEKAVVEVVASALHAGIPDTIFKT